MAHVFRSLAFLFASASGSFGVMSTSDRSPHAQWSFGHAWFALGMIVIISFTGIHPLIGIATLAPLIAPLQPDPTLLGILFLMCWALGTGSSPLSGSNLAICVRYQIAVRDMLRWNLPYAVLGWCCCGAVLALHARLG